MEILPIQNTAFYCKKGFKTSALQKIQKSKAWVKSTLSFNLLYSLYLFLETLVCKRNSKRNRLKDKSKFNSENFGFLRGS
jgi:hypothetical protein